MVVQRNFSVVLKTVSAFVAGIFLFDQIACAGDLVNTALDQQYKDQSQTFAPAYLQTQQAAAESLISQKQAAEDAISAQNLMTPADTQPQPDALLDLKGPVGGSGSGTVAAHATPQTSAEENSTQDDSVISVTTEAGDVIRYKAGWVESVVKKDGTVLTVEGDVLKSSRDPSGIVTNYDSNGRISSRVLPNGETSNYSYRFDETNNVVKTVITTSEYTAEYDKDLKLQSVSKKDGETIEYDSGIVAKMTKPDGGTYIFGKNPLAACEVRATAYIGKDGCTVKFDDAYNILSIASPAGVTTIYSQNKPLLTQGADYAITYNDKSEPLYMFSSPGAKDLSGPIAELDSAIKERVAAQNVLIDKKAILENAAKAETSASAAYTAAQLELNSALTARQALGNSYIYLPQGAIRIGASYAYSKDKITINRTSGFLEYDSQGRMITDNGGNGVVTTYVYKDTETIKTTRDNFDNKAASLLSAPLISGGKLYLKEDPKGIQNVFSKYLYDSSSSAPVYSIDFSVDNQNPGLCIGLKRNNNGDDKKRDRIALFATSSNILVQTYKDGLSTVAVPVLDFKVNTEYTARFEAGPQDIKVYVWEKSGQKPATPNYTWNTGSWDIYSSTGSVWSRAFFGSIVKGTATFDGLSISYKITAQVPNSTIVKFRDAIEKENTAREALNTAKGQYESAVSSTNAAQSAYYAACNILEAAKAKEAIAVAARADIENILNANRVLFSDLPSGHADYIGGTYISDPASYRNGLLAGLDFSCVTYDENNIVKEIVAADGSRTVYDRNGLPVSSSISGVKTDYSYLVGASGQITNAEIYRNNIRAIYDSKGGLSAIVAQDNARIEYNGGEVAAIITPDGIKRLYRAGTLSELIDKDGNTYSYSYSIDPEDSKEATIVDDPAQGIKRYYKNNLLVRTEDVAGLSSDNVYFDDGRLQKVTVKKNDITIIGYEYTYKSGGTTEVRDTEGNARTYSPDGRLVLFSGRDGRSYRYTYPDQQTTRVDYIKISGEILPDDFVIAQDFVSDKLKKAYRLDGTAMVYTDSGKPDYIADAKGETAVDYNYNSDDDLISVTMCAARKNLIIAGETAKNGINDNKAKILADIDKQVSDFCAYFIKTNFSRLNSANSAVRQQAMDDYAKALKPVSDEAAKAKLQVEDQASQQLAKVKEESDRLLLEIARQEATPLTIYYYKTILGRDPDQAEINLWLANVSIDHQQIDKNEIVKSILASGEYNIRKTGIDNIKYRVRAALESYLKFSSPEEKNLFLVKLGLTQQDVTELNRYDVDAILKWIDSQGMHFGQSAFLALKDLLSANGIGSDFEDLATDVTLIDILTGAINTFTSGDLQLSMYGLSKYAESKGLTLYNEKLNFGDLALQMNGVAQKVIAHVDGNHYIVVTGIENDKVYYREANRGPAGTDEVMSKDDFIKKWSGHVISKTKIQDESKVLSASDAKRVKGAFFWLIIPFIAAVISAVAAVVTTVAAIIVSVVSVAASVVSSIAGIIATIGAQLASGIGAALSAIGAAVGNALSTSIVGLAVKTLAGIGLNFGISAGMQALGINSTISNLTASFLTGGALGLINPVAGMGVLNSFICEGLKYTTITGINELGSKLQLNANIASIISMTSGSLVGGLWQGKLGETIVNIAPNIAGEFTYCGIRKLDWLVLPGLCIKNVISAQFDIADSLKYALNSAVVSIGVNLLDDADPAVPAVLRSTILIGAVEGILNKEGLFSSAFTVLNRIIPAAFNEAGNIVTNLFAGARTFVGLVTERGMLGAVDSALNSLFTQSTIGSVAAKGGVEEILSRPAKQVMLSDGRAAQEIAVTDDASLFLDTKGELISVKEGGITCTGSFVWTQDNGLIMKDGTIDGNLETGYNISAAVEEGRAKEINIGDMNGNRVIQVNPEGQGSSIDIKPVSDPSGSVFSLVNAAVCLANTYIYKINQEKVVSIEQKVNGIASGALFTDSNKFIYALANGVRNPEINKDSPPVYILNLMDDLVLHSDNDLSKEKDMLPIPLYQGMTRSSPLNGIIDSLNWLVESQTVYEGALVQKAWADLKKYFDNDPSELNRPIIGMGYSGGFMPLVKAVSSSIYNVKTLIGLGAPSARVNSDIFAIVINVLKLIAGNCMESARSILRSRGVFDETFIGGFIKAAQDSTEAVFPYLKEILLKLGAIRNFGTDAFSYCPARTNLVVNVWGSEDIFYKIGAVDKREDFLGKPTYNIEIMGAGHADYIREIDKPSTWNNTVASFVTDLMLYSKDKYQLEGFIQDQINKGIILQPDERGVYVVQLPGCGI